MKYQVGQFLVNKGSGVTWEIIATTSNTVTKRKVSMGNTKTQYGNLHTVIPLGYEEETSEQQFDDYATAIQYWDLYPPGSSLRNIQILFGGNSEK